MTKQQAYDAMVAKGLNVAPIENWTKLSDPVRVAVNRIRYDIPYFVDGVGFKTASIDVEDDGKAEEKVYLAGANPLLETTAVETFEQRIQTKISSLVTAGTIKAAFQEMSNQNAAIYKVVMADKSEARYLLVDGDPISFEKLI